MIWVKLKDTNDSTLGSIASAQSGTPSLEKRQVGPIDRSFMTEKNFEKKKEKVRENPIGFALPVEEFSKWFFWVLPNVYLITTDTTTSAN